MAAPTSLTQFDIKVPVWPESDPVRGALSGVPAGRATAIADGSEEVTTFLETKAGITAATGATAGIPGTWTGGTTVPHDVGRLAAGVPKTVVANPATAWTTGQYVQTETAGVPGRAHWSGTAWVAGPA